MVMRTMEPAARLILAIVLFIQSAVAVQAAPMRRQTPAPRASVDSLVGLALRVNPEIHAARERLEAARARVSPAGALPDPMIGLGLTNFPVSDPGFKDFMTMKTIALDQTLLFPGKLRLQRRAAEHEVDAARARLRATELAVAADVRKSYYELAFDHRSLEVAEINQKLLVNLIQVTESRYAVGTAGQQDVLKARVEAARLAEEAAALAEARASALARLNALLDQPSDTSLPSPRSPERIARAAVTDSPGEIRFTSAALGARAATSPLPALEELQDRAIRSSPGLAAHQAEIAAQTSRLDFARKAHLPDFNLSLEYGQRVDNADMVSFRVSVPVPLHRRSKQEQQVVEARAELTAMQAEYHAMVNRLRADVAEQYTEIERTRAQLALFVSAIIPQGRATLEAATASYKVGRVEFLTVIENQAALYNYETEYFRALADFATSLAELERVVGEEVLP